MIIKKAAAVICAAVMMTCAQGFSADVSYAQITETQSSAYVSRYQLSDPDANDITKKTYDFICDNFEKYIITCQQESTWMGSPDYEMNYIKDTTGKLPAMRGLDFMNDDFNGVVSRAKAWHEKGGLVTICWHTGVYGKGYTESLNDDPDFSKILTKGTTEYKKMMASWDKAAAALGQLQDAGVTVFWRPFHEFDGQWFWWGKGGKNNFIKLWRMMYDYFTNEKGLHNLIWVLGYSGEVRSGWYPGDDYCDIIGSDTYDNSTNLAGWNRLKALNTGKPLAFHECGNVPLISQFKDDGTIWSWFMIWHTDYITGNNKTRLASVYNSERAITLDEISIDNYVYVTLNTDSETLSQQPVSVSFDDAAETRLTAKDSFFTIPAFKDGTYKMTISAEGFAPRTCEIEISGGKLAVDPGTVLNLKGDINGDKNISATDLLLAKSHIKGAKQLEGYDFSCADIDEDSRINAADLLKMKSHIKGVSPLW
jgi:mannan endo-1,4-beta-mannosidase